MKLKNPQEDELHYIYNGQKRKYQVRAKSKQATNQMSFNPAWIELHPLILQCILLTFVGTRMLKYLTQKINFAAVLHNIRYLKTILFLKQFKKPIQHFQAIVQNIRFTVFDFMSKTEFATTQANSREKLSS